MSVADVDRVAVGQGVAIGVTHHAVACFCRIGFGGIGDRKSVV